MTRFWAFLFLGAITVSSTVSADEAACGNEGQTKSSRVKEGVILRSLMRTSELVETRTETALAPAGVFRKRLPTVSQHSFPVQRTSPRMPIAEPPVKIRRDSLVIGTPAMAVDRESTSIALSFREPAGAPYSEEFSVKQVRFDLEELREELDKANDEEPLDFSESHVAEPPRPLGASDPKRAETEATLDLLRRELRREADRKRQLQTLPRQTNTPQPPQQPKDEPRTPVEAEPLIPPSPGETSIIPDADGLLNLSIDDVDSQKHEQGDRIMEAEESPWPEMAPESQKQMDTWNTESWTLDMLQDDGAAACDPVFCEQMWACAGGRHQSWFQRAVHNLHRNFDVIAVGKCGRCGSHGRGERVAETRSLWSSAAGSCCHGAVDRTLRGRRLAARTTGCDGGCPSTGTCTDCTSQRDCTAAAECGNSGCPLCSTCLGE